MFRIKYIFDRESREQFSQAQNNCSGNNKNKVKIYKPISI